jgi:hypothetical protein
MIGDGDEPESKARRLVCGLRGEEPSVRRRAELHGRLFLSRASVRLSQHGMTPARASARSLASSNPGTIQFWMKAAAERGLRFSYCITSGNEPILACRLPHVSSSTIPTPGRSCCSSKVHPPAGGLHACRRPRARHGQADPRDQDRRNRAIAGGLAVPYRRDAGDIPPISPCANATASSITARSTISVEAALAFAGGRLPKARIGFVTTSGGTVDLLTIMPRPKARPCPTSPTRPRRRSCP